MYGTFKDEPGDHAARDPRTPGLYKHERELTSPQSAHVTTAQGGGAELLRQQLPRPGRPPRRRRRRRKSAAGVGLRHGQRALHLRHADAAHASSSARLSRVPRHRGHDPLLLLLRRQRRRLRDAVRRRGRDHLRRAQPRLAHRRHPPVQGPPAALPQRRHGRPRGAARGRRGRAPTRHRHRRRLLHGRLLRPAGRDLRPGRAVRRAGHGRRLPRRRLRRRGRPRHARALRGAWTASTSSPAPSARRSAAPRAATSARTRRSSTCCASGRGPTCSPTPSPRRSRPGRSPRSSWPRAPTTPGRAAATTPRCSGR